MKKLLPFLLILTCVLGFVGCTTTSVVDIWDRTEKEQLVCATALEKFYEDETAEYYFSCIKSHYIMVRDNTGRTVDIVTALNEGLVTIADLDHYGIKYYTEPKN